MTHTITSRLANAQVTTVGNKDHRASFAEARAGRRAATV
jgi:hypothetical protein